MKKFEGILLCTDLDGTLLNNRRAVSENNLNAIEYFKSEGGIFTFITGRMPFFVHKLYETVRPNAPIGCINGGGIYDFENKEYIWTQELSKSVTDLVEYVENAMPEIGIQVNTFERIYFWKDNLAMEYFRKATGVPHVVRHYKEVDEPFAKILFADTNADHISKLAEILHAHPRAHEFDFIRSEHTLYEILPKGINKGTVLPKLSKYLGIDMANTVAAGDYNNDIQMLRTAGLGFAVANATPEAKAAADRITVSNEEDAIAKIIEELAEQKL